MLLLLLKSCENKEFVYFVCRKTLIKGVLDLNHNCTERTIKKEVSRDRYRRNWETKLWTYTTSPLKNTNVDT